MHKKLIGAILGVAILATAAILHSDTQYSRVENVVYYTNGAGKLGLYLSFELEPNHRYQFQATRDGRNFFDLFLEDTTGRVNDTYESFNIPDPGNGIWPRVLDLGSTVP